MRGGSGIALHDIAFNGSRIVYELSFQDLMVAYSGYGGAVLFAAPHFSGYTRTFSSSSSCTSWSDLQIHMHIFLFPKHEGTYIPDAAVVPPTDHSSQI